MDTIWSSRQAYNSAINQQEVLSTSNEPEISWLEMAMLGGIGNHPSFIIGGIPETNHLPFGQETPRGAEPPVFKTTKLTVALDSIAEDVLAEKAKPYPSPPATPSPRNLVKASMDSLPSPESEDERILQRSSKKSDTPSKATNPTSPTPSKGAKPTPPPPPKPTKPTAPSPSKTSTRSSHSTGTGKPPRVRWSPPFPRREGLPSPPYSHVTYVKGLRDPKFAEGEKKHKDEVRRFRH